MWPVRLGAIVVLLFGVFLFLEVRSTTTQAGSGSSPAEPTKDEAIVTADTPNKTKREKNVTGSEHKLKVPPNPFAPAPTNGGGGNPTLGDAGVAPDDAEEDSVYAKQNGEEPSAYRVRVRIGQLRLERGNYKGALEYVSTIINEEPTFTDAYKVAIPALCAMGDMTTARQYLGRLAPETHDADRKEVMESCGTLGAKLTP